MKSNLHFWHMGRRAASRAGAAFIMSLALGLAGLGFTHLAAADEPSGVANGTFTFTNTVCDNNTPCNGVSFLIDSDFWGTYVIQGHYAGDLSSELLTGSGTFVAHSDGSLDFWEFDVVRATLVLKDGTVLRGVISGPSQGHIDPAGNQLGTDSFTGSGGLAGLHLKGKFVLPAGAAQGTYSYKYNFED